MMRRLVFVVSMVVSALVASAVFVAPPAHAALGLRETPDQTWMTNGIVYASALSEDGNTLYIGGKFTSVREKPPGTSGETLAVNNVAAINVATGTPITTWKPAVTSNDGTRPEVRALAAKDGRVYIGGKFTTVGGQPRRNLAAVDASTGALSSFAPTVGDGTSVVYALAANATKLYVGGKFTSVNGTSRSNLAAFALPSGALDTAWRARANGMVRDLEFDSSGATIFAVGGFASVSCGTAGAVARQSVARFATSTCDVHPWAVPQGTIENPMMGWHMTVTPSRLFVGFGLTPNFVSAFRLDNGNSGSQVWRFGLVGNPQASAMSPDGSRLIVGGHFGINPLDQRVCFFTKQLKGLVALNPLTGSVDCSWVPSLDQQKRPEYDGAWTVQSTGNYVWVGGKFIGVSGVPQHNLARFTYAATLP